MSRSKSEIEAWLRQHISEILGIYRDEVDVDTAFMELGLDSVTGLELSVALEDWLGKPIAPTFFGEHPTIRAVARALGTS